MSVSLGDGDLGFFLGFSLVKRGLLAASSLAPLRGGRCSGMHFASENKWEPAAAFGLSSEQHCRHGARAAGLLRSAINQPAQR